MRNRMFTTNPEQQHHSVLAKSLARPQVTSRLRKFIALFFLSLFLVWFILLALATTTSSIGKRFVQEKRSLLRLTENKRSTSSNTATTTTTLTPFGNVFLAANFYNSESIVVHLLPEILRFARMLQASSEHEVFVSLQENGSTDRTSQMLLDFQKQLEQHNISHFVATSNVDWRDYCKESGIWASPDDGKPPECTASSEVCPRPLSLRKCDHSIRIPIMATLRNKALEPLSKWKEERRRKGKNQRDMKRQKQRQKQRTNEDTAVLFVNDVLTTAEDMLVLMNGKGTYDMMCGMVSRFFSSFFCKTFDC